MQFFTIGVLISSSPVSTMVGGFTTHAINSRSSMLLSPKSKSLWMVKSSNISVCSKASTGGALVLLAVMGEPYLSRYDNILWMMAAWGDEFCAYFRKVQQIFKNIGLTT